MRAFHFSETLLLSFDHAARLAPPGPFQVSQPPTLSCSSQTRTTFHVFQPPRTIHATAILSGPTTPSLTVAILLLSTFPRWRRSSDHGPRESQQNVQCPALDPAAIIPEGSQRLKVAHDTSASCVQPAGPFLNRSRVEDHLTPTSRRNRGRRA